MSQFATVLDQSNPGRAVEVLQARISNGESTLGDLANFAHDRISVEKRYIEDLQRIAQRHASTIGTLDNDEASMNSTVNSVDKLWRKIAVRDINESIGASETYVRRVKSEVERPLKSFVSSQQGDWSDVKVLAQGLNELSQSQSEWQKQAPYVFTRFEKADTDRVVFAKDAITQFLTLSTDKSQQFIPVAERLLNDVLTLEPEEDIKAFVTDALSGKLSVSNQHSGVAGTSGAPEASRSANYASSAISANPRSAFRRASTKDSDSIYSTNSARNSTHEASVPHKRGERLRSKVGSIFGRKKKDDKKHVSTLGTIRDQPGQQQRSRDSDWESKRRAEIEEQKAIERQIQEDREEERRAAGQRAERVREQTERTNKQQPPLPPASRSPDNRMSQAAFDTAALSSQLQFPSAGAKAKDSTNEVNPVPVQQLSATPVGASSFDQNEQSQFKLQQHVESAPAENGDKPLPPPSRQLSDIEPHAPPKVDIRQDMIPEEGDANQALSSVASALKSTPLSSQGSRARRDIQSTLFTDIQPSDIESQGHDLVPHPIDTSNINGDDDATNGAVSEEFHSPIAQSPESLSRTPSATQTQANFSLPPPSAPFAQPVRMNSSGGDSSSIRSFQSASPNVIKHPELLTAEVLESFPLRASIVEQINANIGENDNSVSVVGEVAIAYVPSSSAHAADHLRVRVVDQAPYLMFGANPSAVVNPPASLSEGTVYDVSAAAVMGRTSLGFKYSLTPEAAVQSLPVVITPIWRFEPQQARLMLSIKLGSNFPGEAAALTGGVFSVSVDGANTLSAQSKPVGSFSPERRRITWRIGDSEPFIIRKDTEQRLLCQFKTDGLVHPSSNGVDARFTLTSSLQEGILEWSDGGDWQPVGHIKSFISGKFNCR